MFTQKCKPRGNERKKYSQERKINKPKAEDQTGGEKTQEGNKNVNTDKKNSISLEALGVRERNIKTQIHR